MQKIQELIADICVRELRQQKSQLFLWAPVCFIVGIGSYFALKTEPSVLLGGSLSLFSLGAGVCLWRYRDFSAGYKFSFIFSVGVFLTCLGFTAAQVRSHLVYTPMLLKKMSPVGVIGTIETIEPLSANEGSRVVLTDLEIERLTSQETPHKVRLKIRKSENLHAGQRIDVLAGLNPASGPVAPGAFDFQRAAYFKGIGAVGFAYIEPRILKEAEGEGFQLTSIRYHIANNVVQHAEDPQQSVLIALMTGQRAAIRDQDWDALRASGLAHLLAISGLHVGMVAGVLFFFSRLLLAFSSRLALSYPIKKWAAAIALIGAFFYTMIVGATIPTQRALMMTGLVMMAIIFDRSPFSLRLVVLAAFVVLLLSPESLTSVSFQMSFAAVTALICFYEFIRPVWMAWHRQAGIVRRFLLYFAGVSLTTVIAGAATGLFALYHFQNYAAYGVLANMVAVPLMAFIVMPLVVLSYVLMPLGMSGFPLDIAQWGVSWILATAHWVSGLEGAVWHVPNWPQWIFVLMVFSLWAWMIWQGRLRHIMIPVFFVLVVITLFHRQPHILISSKVDLISVRDEQDDLWFSTGRKERYAAENWLRRNGQSKSDKKIWPREGGEQHFPLHCDVYGCRGEVERQKISVAFSNKAWREDCNWADLMISQKPIPYKACQAKHVIDFFDVWRNGPHAIWLSADNMKIETVEGVRGKRLWTQTAANKKGLVVSAQ